MFGYFGRKNTANSHFFLRTILIYILAAYVGASVYSSVVLDPLERAALDAIQDLPAEEFEEPAPLFIPFPGTTKQLPLVPYRGTDPEWQEFVKFSKDKKLAQKVRGTHRHVNSASLGRSLTDNMQRNLLLSFNRSPSNTRYCRHAVERK